MDRGFQDAVVRRAVEKSRRKREQQHLQDLLRSLEDLTGLSSSELKQIAAEAGSAQASDPDTFFSIRQQLSITAAALLALALFTTWLL